MTVFSDLMDRRTAHGSAAGLTTIKTAAATFYAAVEANLPGSAQHQAKLAAIFQDRLTEILQELASEFPGP